VLPEHGGRHATQRAGKYALRQRSANWPAGHTSAAVQAGASGGKKIVQKISKDKK
jgi:hypothetical protein